MSVEPLEGRRLLTTFVVTNTTDFGPGSLQQAILDANGHAGRDEIHFNIPSPPGGGIIEHEAYSLPAVTEAVTIDGFTQPGSSPNTDPAGDNAVRNIRLRRGLVFTAGGNTIRGLNLASVRLEGGGGNTVSGNAFRVVIGDNSLGLLAGGDGNNQIGGTSPQDRNTFSGYRGSAIVLASSNNVVEGNIVGTRREIYFEDNLVGVAVSSTGNRIGGPTPGAGNYILLNKTGLSLSGSGHIIQGNLIGNDGVTAMPNEVGISLNFACADVLVGGTTPGARNIISGNRYKGILIDCEGVNRILGNYIGPRAAGDAPPTGAGDWGSGGNGVAVRSGSGNMIGGTGPGEANLIAFNGGAGVTILPGSTRPTVSNSIRGNSMHSNGRFLTPDPLFGPSGFLGIELGLMDGPDKNDDLDADDGPNKRQNTPMLDAAVSESASQTTHVAGSLHSAPDSSFTIDFYSNLLSNAHGYVEGETHIGSTTVTTHHMGLGIFAVELPAATGAAHKLTATATDAQGNTSEFSAPLSVTAATVPDPVVGVPAFTYWTSPAEVLVRFDADVSASLDRTDLLVDNPLTGAPPFHPASFSWDAADKTAHFVLAPLANGDYRARLPADSVRAPGYSLVGDVTLEFFVLAGDIDRDRSVTFSDLVVLAQNHGRTGTIWASGDLNADGNTNFADLTLVAQNYGATVPPPSPSASASSVIKSSTSERPVFSTRPLAPKRRPGIRQSV
jgi:hypothetical protein